MEEDNNYKSIKQLCYLLDVEKKIETRNRIFTQLVNSLQQNISLFRKSYKLQKLVISLFLKFIEKQKNDLTDLIIYIRNTLIIWPSPLYTKTVQENIKILRILLTYNNYRSNISNDLKSSILGLCMQKLIAYNCFEESIILNEETKYKSKEYIESDDNEDSDYEENDDDDDYKPSESETDYKSSNGHDKKIKSLNDTKRKKVFQNKILEISKCFSFLIPSTEIVYNEFSLEEEKLFTHPSTFDYSSLSFINTSKLDEKKLDATSQYDDLYPSSITLQSLLIFFKAYLIGYINNCNLNGRSINFIIQEILRNNFSLALSFATKIFDDILSQWDTKLLEMKIQNINFFRIFILMINRPKKPFSSNYYKIDKETNNEKQGFKSSEKINCIINNKNKEKQSTISSSSFLYYDFKKYLYRLYLKIKSCEGSEFIKKFIVDHLSSKDVSFGEFLNNQQKSSFFEPFHNKNDYKKDSFTSFFSPIFFDDISLKYTQKFSKYPSYFNSSYSSDELVFIKWAFYNLIWQDHIDELQILMNCENNTSKYKENNNCKEKINETVDNMSISSCSTELLFHKIQVEPTDSNRNDSLNLKSLNDKNLMDKLENDFINIEFDILKSFDYFLISHKNHVVLFNIQDFTDKLVELLSFFLIEDVSIEVQIWVIAALAQISSNYSNCEFDKSSLSTILSKPSVNENNFCDSNYNKNVSSDNNRNLTSFTNYSSYNKTMKKTNTSPSIDKNNNINTTNPIFLMLISRVNLLSCNNSIEMMWNSIWNTLLHKVLINNLTEPSFYFLGKIIKENVLAEDVVYTGCNFLWKSIIAKSIPLVPSGVNFLLNYLNKDNNTILTSHSLVQNLLQWLLSYFQTGIEVMNKQIYNDINDSISLINTLEEVHLTPSPFNPSHTYNNNNNNNNNNSNINSTQFSTNLFSTVKKSSTSEQTKSLNRQDNIDQICFLRTPQLIAIFLSLFVTSINFNNDVIKENNIQYNQFQQYIPIEEMAFEYQFLNQYLHLNYFNYGFLKQFISFNRVSNSYDELLNNFQIKDNLLSHNIKENNKDLINDFEYRQERKQQTNYYKESEYISLKDKDKVFTKSENSENGKNKKLKFNTLSSDNENKEKIKSFLVELIYYCINCKLNIFDNNNKVKNDFVNVFNHQPNTLNSLNKIPSKLFQDDYQDRKNLKSIKKRKINNIESNNIITFFSEPQQKDIFDDLNEPLLNINQEIAFRLQNLICWKLHFLNILLNFIDIILHTSKKILLPENINTFIKNYYEAKKTLLHSDLIDLLFPNLLNDYTFIKLLPDFFENIINDLKLLFQLDVDKEDLIPIIDSLNNCFNIGNEYYSSNNDPFSLYISDLSKYIYNQFIQIDGLNTLNDIKKNSFNFFKDTQKNSILLKRIYYKLLLKEKNINDLIQLIESYFDLKPYSQQQDSNKRPNNDNDDNITRNNKMVINYDYDLDINKSIQYYLYFHPFVSKPKIVYFNKILTTSLINLISINISKDIKYNNKYISFSDYISSYTKENYSLKNYSESLFLLIPKLSTHCIISYQFVQFIHFHKGRVNILYFIVML
ncbi:hypothetical protein BCR36DRAFT_404847 [Piromyces finnis]|uniref:Uncharacterized protein n=1 Tax=Piromyces finnis TaxID=1754191 RepID=A0A1Y1V6Z4_9FUNG|nr:hypothetical protein BCR36DRAFT_404847 [Piromyces finnis]|eukprot:ORX48896.1 hypothetical protein BCR36DRAFT_404847 [Piromyces finnis]